ncbi:hypothetical protein ACOYR1_00830 [Thalassotalea piscium]
MSWKQFHFKCRFFLHKINEGSTLQQAAQLFETSDLNTLYSDQKLTGTQKELFDKILQLTSINETKRALALYSSINFSENLSSSNRYKNILHKFAYLDTITLVFVVFITIYQLFVYPVFFDLVTQYPKMADSTFSFLPSLWVLGIIIAALTLLCTFSCRKYIKNLDTLIVRLPSKLMTFITPKKAVSEMVKLNKIINTPFKTYKVSDDFDKKIDALHQMGLDDALELSLLFVHHSEKLEFIIWQKAKRMVSVMYTIVTIAIAFYIVQIYDPIFKIGVIIE